MYPLILQGTLEASPPLNKNGGHTRRDGTSADSWLIARFSLDTSRLYCHLAHLAAHRTVVYQAPLWGAHISVVRDEHVPDRAAFRSLDGLPVQVAVSPRAEETGVYLWLPVDPAPLSAFRQRIGLSALPPVPFHLTVGNRKPRAQAKPRGRRPR